MTALRFFAVVLLSGTIPVHTVCADPAPATRPTIRFNATKTAIDVRGLDPADLVRLARATLDGKQWQALFAVYVLQDGQEQTPDQPAVLGSYRVEGEVVRFAPRFPLTPGVRYRAVFHPAQLPGHQGDQAPAVVTVLSLPRPATPPTVVEQVYPSGDALPENHLRFYIHFSAPMRQGYVYDHIHLLDEAGKPLDHPFLELDEELWDPQSKRFTLFFHPGRIKKGLKPREELGPILEAGKRYTLVIERAWKDAAGNPLREAYRKTFRVGPAEEKTVDPHSWKIQPPTGGSTRPLSVQFPQALDHALLERFLWVTDAQGQKVPGKGTIGAHETLWQFTPERPWQPGRYQLVVDTRLEDLAGNSLRRPFELDVFHPIERQITTETIQLPVSVPAPTAR